MDEYSIFALLFSLIYVFYAIRNSKWCFPFAFIASIIWAYADFKIYNLKFDGGLQLFYAIMAIVGWLKWQKQDSQGDSVIKNQSFNSHIVIILFGIIVSFILVYLLSLYSDTDLPYLDATTTVFSVFATFMLIFRFIENWIYLLVCDLLYIYIYFHQGAYVLLFIMVIYSVLAFLGYFSWLKQMKFSENISK